ncbi:MAG: UvrD-helicase domain-containing protein [Treponema sp.]|nr:UvrD-helicase domain-containing protein [Treponema sp.]
MAANTSIKMNTETNLPQLNEEQKKAAFCTENAVVAAGAGSGKTMVLANRFAWLITEKGYKVDEILTLTFTNKAAAQMFRRIHSILSEIAENGETGEKSSRARKALDDFIHARIQTLDSYCTALVKQCAPRYGINPDFLNDQEKCRQIATEESLAFLITHSRHPAIEKLYSIKQPNKIACDIFAEILFNHCQIDKPRDFIADVKTQFSIICIEWKKQCGELKNLLAETENIISDNTTLLPDFVHLMWKKGKINFPEVSDIQKYFDFLLSIPYDSCIEKAEAHPIQKSMTVFLFFLTELRGVPLPRGKTSGNQQKENLKNNLNQIRVIYDTLTLLAVSVMQAGFTISMMSLFEELQDSYLDRKRAEGVLTFQDVSGLCRTILVEQPDIRQSEKESYKAIMIDEFQDNNEQQKDLLFLLAEKQDVINSGVPAAKDLCPGKLFFVGDEKQSVYLFRGADVSVFRKLKDELTSAGLTLKINYRSAPALIGAFNAVFGGSNFDPKGKKPLSEKQSVFAPVLQSLPLYEASYTPLEAGKEGSGKFSVCILNKNTGAADDSGAEETEDDHETEDNSELSANENEARFTAEKIRKLLDEKTETGGQKYQPKDIAVLLRTRKPQYLFEKHLRLLGIPYISEEINDLFYAGPVNDIMSVLRLAAYPLDSASYAEMLRSPFAGLTLHGTAMCLSVFKKAETPEPFNDEPLSYLDEEDKNRYRHGQRIYSSICGKAESENISSLISELWYNEGYRYETEWNPVTNAYREFYDYLFHLAVKADTENKGLAAFTDFMRIARDNGGHFQENTIPLERPGAVNLLTIHKSKGLEFPVVFLCFCGNKSQTDRSGEVYFSNETGIAFNPPLPADCYLISKIKNNFFWQQASGDTKRKRTAELRRLLYVGMTRAEKELYVTGSLAVKDDEKTDDFSISIKNYIEKKCEEKWKKSKNPICGDTVLDDNTFFGLLLPSIVSHIPIEGFKKNDSSFFNIEEIPIYTEEYIRDQETKYSHLSDSHIPDSYFPTEQKSLNEFIDKAKIYFQNAEKIQTPVLRDNHITPVSLRNIVDTSDTDIFDTDTSDKKNKFIVNKEYSGEKSGDVFEKVDSLLEKLSHSDDENTEKFNSGSFGTIAHICVEALLNAEEPLIPSNITGFLNPAEENAFLEAGKELACRFIRSPLGKIAEKAELVESEFPFRKLIKNEKGEEIFINGNIDLFFEDKDSFHVVDFKTDSREMPEEHIAQTACYYHAVSALFSLPAKKKCRVWLYYLRTGHVIEMTEIIMKFNLEQRAFSYYNKLLEKI